MDSYLAEHTGTRLADPTILAKRYPHKFLFPEPEPHHVAQCSVGELYALRELKQLENIS
jgi:hypothetical protein